MVRGDLRLGLVGCGRLAERGYLPAIGRLPGVTLAAVADPVRERCERLASGLPAFDGAEGLIDAGRVDALVLATPAQAHLDDARLAAQAGLPTLVEKPPAPDAAAALELAKIDPPPWIGFNRRFDPGLRRIRSAVPDAGALELRLELHYPRGAWASHTVVDDALESLGTHLIDLARWLTAAEIVTARAVALDRNRAAFELELERGRAHVACSRGQKRVDLVELLDGDGNLLARHRRRGRLGGAAARLVRLRGPNGLVALLVAELECFARAASGGRSGPLATAADGAAVMAALAAVRRSAGKGGARARVL